MPNPAFFRSEFDSLATDGQIGDPNGQPAYAYIRVSSGGQAEEGKDGLPRQIRNIHEKAMQAGLCIAWDMLYADDDSGFEFRNRPNLTELRKELKLPKRRGQSVVIEHLDRLSRNADWHQGFLLHEMRSAGVQPVFWKEFNSRIERAVMGAVSQEGMEQTKERMRAGARKKAENGYVTAKTAAYGYRLVGPDGMAGTKRARRLSKYAIYEPEAIVVRLIFDMLAVRAASVRQVCRALDQRAATDMQFKPRRAKAWGERTVVQIVRKPLYKGQFVANRYQHETEYADDGHGGVNSIRHTRQRPPEEWVYIDVPPIVDAATWQRANDNLDKGQQRSKRNTKHEYLLGGGLVRCAGCGWVYVGHTDRWGVRRYMCSKSNHQTPEARAKDHCPNKSVRADVLESQVMAAVRGTLLNRKLVDRAIDVRYSGDKVQAQLEEIRYVESQIASCDTEEEQWRRIYLNGGFTADEFAAEHKRLSAVRQRLQNQASALKAELVTPEELEAKKQSAMTRLKEGAQSAKRGEQSFASRQRMVRDLIDEITVNTQTGDIEIRGVIGLIVLKLGDTTDRKPSF